MYVSLSLQYIQYNGATWTWHGIVINFIDGDPTNYLTYFKRAAVYLAIGHAKRAIPDLDKTISLKPDFNQVMAVVMIP